ncbi:MAG: histidine triad nucleotide-binding protein [Deltaproteobacteria bacterium]|nr:histidine triad nucleotide-binding protein [Deltaproteobacteria bacterium]
MKDCIFCRIARGDIPSSKVYETERVVAFDDINPMAPVHVIVIPKEHIATLMEITETEGGLMTEIVAAVQEAARLKGVDRTGFRVVVNCNEDGGQVIFHLHVHVLGGRKLQDELG